MKILAFGAALSLGAVLGLFGVLQDKEKVKAPELKGGKGWLNTDQPVTLESLKGKIVLLDFWTFG